MSDIIDEMGGYNGDGSEFTLPTQDPKNGLVGDVHIVEIEESKQADGYLVTPATKSECVMCGERLDINGIVQKEAYKHICPTPATKPLDEQLRHIFGKCNDVDKHICEFDKFTDVHINDRDFELLKPAIKALITNAEKQARIDELRNFNQYIPEEFDVDKRIEEVHDTGEHGWCLNSKHSTNCTLNCPPFSSELENL